MKKEEYLVHVNCETFNHVKYIENALNGFTMQETTFPYVCTILDDASTDGEQEVIRKFLEQHFDMEDKSTLRNEETNDYLLTFARHKTNKNCHFAVIRLKYNHYSIKKSKLPYLEEWKDIKYIAYCEGDDYWTDSQKLQKQIDILESHPEYGFVYTDFNLYDSDKDILTIDCIKSGNNIEIKTFEEHLLEKAYIAPMSWVYRNGLLDSLNPNGLVLLNSLNLHESSDGSFIIALELFLHSNAYFLSDNTCIHIIHGGSVAHQTSYRKMFEYHRGVHNTQLFYVSKYNVNDPHHQLDWYYKKYASYLIARNEKEEFESIISYIKRKEKKNKKDYIIVSLLKTRFTASILHMLAKKILAKKLQS